PAISPQTRVHRAAPPRRGAPAAPPAPPAGKGGARGAPQTRGGPAPPFEIPEPIFTAWRKIGARGKSQRRKWLKRHAAMADPDRAEFDRRLKGDIPPEVDAAIAAFKAKVAAEKPSWATRKSSQEAL